MGSYLIVYMAMTFLHISLSTPLCHPVPKQAYILEVGMKKQSLTDEIRYRCIEVSPAPKLVPLHVRTYRLSVTGERHEAQTFGHHSS